MRAALRVRSAFALAGVGYMASFCMYSQLTTVRGSPLIWAIVLWPAMVRKTQCRLGNDPDDRQYGGKCGAFRYAHVIPV